MNTRDEKPTKTNISTSFILKTVSFDPTLLTQGVSFSNTDSYDMNEEERVEVQPTTKIPTSFALETTAFDPALLTQGVSFSNTDSYDMNEEERVEAKPKFL